MLNVIKALLAIILTFSICNLSSYAMTPEEYCKGLKDAGINDTCIPKELGGEYFVKIIGNLGEEAAICKKCPQDSTQCTITDEKNCE